MSSANFDKCDAPSSPRILRLLPMRRRLCLIAVLSMSLMTMGPPVQAAPSTAVAVTGTKISFSGRSWTVKSSTGLVGPGPNVFSSSPENVWVDSAGQLHMRITYRNGQWLSAEVILDQSLGYGTYDFSIASAVGSLDPNVVLGLFTWNDNPAYNHREIDVEFARWGNPANSTNAQYVVQPHTRTGNIKRFTQPALTAPSSHSFAWMPKSVLFSSSTANSSIASWKYTGSSIPKPGGENARINLWLDGGRAPQNGAEVEVVLSKFNFTPR